jgi:glycosyltransferase involved in cell wall biosynthesis/thioredoxin-like negative regulator of GroEL
MDNPVSEIRELIAAGNIEDAESALSDALQTDPFNPELLNLQAEIKLKIGSLCWERGDVDNAIDKLSQALQMNPHDRHTVLKCVEILTALEQYETVVKLYKSYLEKMPDDTEMSNALAKLSLIAPISKPRVDQEEQLSEWQSNIKVSAIVSTYNSERFMRGCLEDLINQTLYQKGELEIIVIDSGSEQNEKAIVEEFQKTHENIIYIRTKRESVYAAWNRGIKLASGKYITNANADDRHRYDALEIMADKLDQNPGIGLVYADVIKTATENETFEHHTPIGAYKWKDFSRELLTAICFMGPQPMWRKSLHDKYGYFDESFTSSGDWEFWLRIAEDTRMLHIPEFLGLYLYSSQGAEHRDKENRVREDLQILQKYVPKYLATTEDVDRGLNALKEMDQKHGNIPLVDPLENALLQLRQYTGGMKLPEHLPTDISVSREAFGEPTSHATEIQVPVERSQTPPQKFYRTDFVSVILLVHGDLDSTRRCLRSIRKYTTEPHEILFVPLDPLFDPPKWMRKLIKERQNYRMVTPIPDSLHSNKPVIPARPVSFFKHTPLSPLDRGESDRFPTSGNDNLKNEQSPNDFINKGRFHEQDFTFSEACNAGITESTGEHILILDDSVVVTEGWLSGMLDCLRRVDDAGIIGPMITNVEGPQGIEIRKLETHRDSLRQIETGKKIETYRDSSSLIETVGKVETRGDSSRFVEKEAKDFNERNKYRRVFTGKLKYPCLLFSHKLADAVGLFDDRFRSPEFAVEDYCLRVAMEGFNNFIAGDVLISYSKDQTTVEKKREIFTEKRSFVSKWSVVDHESTNSHKLFAVNALMASREISGKGDMNKALSILMDGLGSSPEDKRLHHALVELLIRQRKFRDALHVLNAMPDSLKNSERWFEFTGICKEGMQEYDDADSCAEKLLAMNEKSPVALNLKGMRAYRQVNRPDAEKLFRSAIDCDPGFGDAYANLGALQWSAKNYEPAFTLLEKAFILSPTSEDIATNYHAAAVALSRLERAVFIIREATAFHPSYKQLRFMLADLLLQREQYQEAMDVMEEALLAFDMDDNALAIAVALREKIGAKTIQKGPRIQGAKGTSDQQQDSRSQEAKDSSEIQKSVIARSEATKQSQSSPTDEIAARPIVARNDKVQPSDPRIRESANPTLSVCIIVKNEEKNIGKCLRNIKPLADEMIVVDTGSTDRTKDIAKVFGAKVYDFEWTNNFADARNHSLSKASGEWILVLDADEVIAPEDFEKLRALINRDSVETNRDSIEIKKRVTRGDSVSISLNQSHSVSSSQSRSLNKSQLVSGPHQSQQVAYSLISRNYSVSMNIAGWIGNDGTYLNEEMGTGWSPSKKVRLFPNDPRIRFENPVHEFVENSLKAAGIPIRDCDVPIHHYGKLDMTKVSKKGEQYYELGKVKSTSDDDLPAIFELAVQAAELGQYEDALVHWNRFIALNPDYSKAFYGLGYAHYSLKHYQEAFSAFKQAAAVAHDEIEWRDAVLQLAHAAIGGGKPQSCIEYLERLLRKDPAFPMTLLLLSVAHVCSGDSEKGTAYLNQLERLNFDGTPYLAYFAELHLSEQRVATALSLLNMARNLGRMPNRIAALIAECERRMREQQDSRGQGFKDSSQTSDNVIARSEATWQSLSHSEKDEIAALPLVARNDKQEDSTDRSFASSSPGTLSLCMIVRDEENNIQRALASIRPVVDEMIVVDTGSTDRTKDIANELGAKVYDFAWTDSFADARNFALSKATSDWILILDADEVISPSDHEELRKLLGKGPRSQGVKESGAAEKDVIARSEATWQSLSHSEKDEIAALPLVSRNDNQKHLDPGPLESLNPSSVAYLFITRNYVRPANTAGWTANDGKYPIEEAGTGWFPGEKVRLFPNDKNLRFENPVHERIEPSLERLGIGIRQCLIPVHHYGMLDDEKIRSKNEYYYDLGRKRLAEKGREDFRSLYDLAVQASGIGRYGEALEYFQQAIALNPAFAKAYESLGNTHYNLKQYDQALSSYKKSLELDLSSRDAMVMSAQCEIIAGDPGRAIQMLDLLLKEEPSYEKALFLIAAAHFTIGEREKGIEYGKQLKDVKSGMIGYFRDFAQLLSAHNRTREAQLLLDAVEELKERLG